MLLQGLQVSKSGLEAALCSALSWRPGAFRGATLACAEPVCGPGDLRVPCAPVPGARSPAAGGEHQGEEWGQLQGAGVQGDLGFKVPWWVTTEEPVAAGLWLPSALRGAH